MHVNSYKDLKVYKVVRELSKEVFELTKSFPAEERYSLISQIRRSSRSIGAQIAEAWAKRRYAAHFVSKLTERLKPFAVLKSVKMQRITLIKTNGSLITDYGSLF